MSVFNVDYTNENGEEWTTLISITSNWSHMTDAKYAEVVFERDYPNCKIDRVSRFVKN